MSSIWYKNATAQDDVKFLRTHKNSVICPLLGVKSNWRFTTARAGKWLVKGVSCI